MFASTSIRLHEVEARAELVFTTARVNSLPREELWELLVIDEERRQLGETLEYVYDRWGHRWSKDSGTQERVVRRDLKQARAYLAESPGLRQHVERVARERLANRS